MFETDSWPFVPAKYQLKGRKRAVRLVVIHSTESLEVEGGAVEVAHYFQHPSRPGSSHVVVDDKDVVQCVRDSDTAAGAAGANQDGIHIEQVGKADQTPLEWDDPYSRAVIKNCANVTAQYCMKFDIPIRRLTVKQIRAGEKGICGHADISQAYPGTGHYDPGPNYPWTEFLNEVQTFYDSLPGSKQ
jgi:N-acetyl-anhydromuramyl-L-alanine amidase AmpD